MAQVPDSIYTLSPDQLKLILEAVPACVFFKDTKGRYQIVSHLYTALIGSGDSIIGKTIFDIPLEPTLQDQLHKEDMEVLQTGKGIRVSRELIFHDMSYFCEISKTPVYDHSGEVLGIVGVLQDMTNVMTLEQKLMEHREIDPLTDVYNRFHYQKLLDGGCIFPLPLAVIMADCNRLKHINDTLGHNRGDSYLISTVNNIRNALDGHGEIIRLGGDEFLILIPECGEEECVNFIRTLTEREAKILVHNIPLSTAYGYSIMYSSSDSLESAVDLADQSMYQAKARFKAASM